MNQTFLILTSLVFLSGCASLDSKIHPRSTSSLGAEAQQIVTRPQEQGLKYVGRTTGSASSRKLFGIIELENDAKVKGDVVMIGKRPEGKLEEIAAFRAVDSESGDAFYKLRTHTEDYKFIHPLIYREKKVMVSGMVYNVEDLGRIDVERADEMRKNGVAAQVVNTTGFLPSVIYRLKSTIGL